MSNSSQQFCLFLEPDVLTELPTKSEAPELRYVELPDRTCVTDRNGTLTQAQGEDAAISLEPIRSRKLHALLMTLDGEAQVTVNGTRAARLKVLNPGDVVGIEDHVLHVSLLNRPYVGPPHEQHLGVECGYCRVKVQDVDGMRIYVCPNCNLPTHCQADEVPVETRLECVTLSSECGHCRATINQVEGFTYVPTL